jgi:Ca2+-dependent lipid-binding protein
MTRFQLFVHAENLPRSIFRRPNPYAIVRFGKPEVNGAEIGRTEVLPQNTDPEWARILFVEAEAAKITYVTVSIYDHNTSIIKKMAGGAAGINTSMRSAASHSLLGEATFEVTEVNQSPGHYQEQSLLSKRSKLFLSVLQSSSTRSVGTLTRGGLGQGGGGGRMVTLQFRGLDIRNVEPGLLGLGRSDPFLEIAKKNTDHNAGIVRWNVVHRTEAINNHLNPFWKEFSMSLEELCDEDINSPLLISVLDLNTGKNRKIGEFETTLAQLKERVAVKGNADREMAFPLGVDDCDTHGLICCLKVDLTGGGGDEQSTVPV